MAALVWSPPRAAVVVLTAIMVLRLVWLQVGGAVAARAAVDANRLWQITDPAPRGRLLDRHGTELATNTSIWWQRQVASNGQIAWSALPIEQLAPIQATAPATVRQDWQRFYPYGPLFAPLLGYTSNPDPHAVQSEGITGLEAKWDDQLQGTPGEREYERRASGVATRLLHRALSQPGEDLTLTLDANLTAIAAAAMGEQRGVVLVSQPKTGEILVGLSWPGYWPVRTAADMPATAAGTWSAPTITAALADERTPLLWRPGLAQYPAGSVFKMLTAVAALEAEAITASTQVRDDGELKVGDFTYQNWLWRQFGRSEGDISVERALARSNDIFFYRAAEWVGPQQLADMARLFGLGAPTGIGINGEKSGLVPDPQWKQEKRGEPWYLGNTFHFGIGQGDLLVTPLQVHQMMSALVQGGRVCTPKLRASDPQECRDVSISSETQALVRSGLRQACSPGGTGVPFFSSSYDVLCKTGTAEFGAEDERGFRPTHGWFTAALSRQERTEDYRSTFSPDLVITVLIESDENEIYKEGSKHAAPVAKAVADGWWANQSNNLN